MMRDFYLLICVYLFAALPANSQFHPAIESEFQARFDDFMADHPAIGYSVSVRDSDDEWAAAQGMSAANDPLTPQHLMAMGSVSKTITAATILQMMEDGLLTLDQQVDEHLPPTPYVTPTITIRQLLNHTSGLYNYTSHPDFLPTLLYNGSQTLEPLDILTNYMSSSSFNPGTWWGYSNTNYLVLGLIIDEIAGQDYYLEAADRFEFETNYPSMGLCPEEIGFNDLAHVWIDTNGPQGYFDIQESSLSLNARFTSAGAAGGYAATPGDLSQWTHDLFSGDMLAPTTMDELLDPAEFSDDYGLGAYVKNTDCGLEYYGHPGGIWYRTESYYCPDLDLAVTMQTNDAVVGNEMEAFINDLFCYYANVVSTPEQARAVSMITASPNPAQDVLTLNWSSEVPDSQSHLVEVVNHLGAVVSREAFPTTGGHQQQIQLDVSDLSEGVYTVLVHGAGTVASSRVVKIQ